MTSAARQQERERALEKLSTARERLHELEKLIAESRSRVANLETQLADLDAAIEAEPEPGSTMPPPAPEE